MILRNINLGSTIMMILFLFVIQSSIQGQVSDSIKLAPQPKLVTLNLDSPDYQSIFKGSPETITFHSGLVTLKKDEKVGHHNTDEYEEILVIFGGEGQMTIKDGVTMNLKYGVIAYCPPYTEHDVICTSSAPLKYLYVASKTK